MADLDTSRAVARMDTSREVARMDTSREVARMDTSRAAVRMGTSRAVLHMVASPDLIRSRRQQAVAGRRRPPEPHNLAHKMRGESQPCRQIRK
jgi:hypothetical protein